MDIILGLAIVIANIIVAIAIIRFPDSIGTVLLVVAWLYLWRKAI